MAAMSKLLLFLWLLATVAVPAAIADSNTHLQDGTPILIDENSRTVYVLEGTVRRPLWDGVHRLENGSTFTVNGGILINEFRSPEARSPRHGPPGAPSSCEVLVTRVCGSDNHCAANPGCPAARQFLQMEEKERAPGDPPSIMTPTSDSCAEALGDAAYFASCPTR
ncbi:exported hypothetical protein [Gammaproteobacteria bacterium]